MSLSIFIPLIILSLLILAAAIGVTVYFAVRTSESSVDNKISDKNLKIVDLIGAGDLFAAGFLHGFINKLSTKYCLEKGTEMSSKVIQQIGARL